MIQITNEDLRKQMEIIKEEMYKLPPFSSNEEVIGLNNQLNTLKFEKARRECNGETI